MFWVLVGGLFWKKGERNVWNFYTTMVLNLCMQMKLYSCFCEKTRKTRSKNWFIIANLTVDLHSTHLNFNQLVVNKKMTLCKIQKKRKKNFLNAKEASLTFTCLQIYWKVKTKMCDLLLIVQVVFFFVCAQFNFFKVGMRCDAWGGEERKFSVQTQSTRNQTQCLFISKRVLSQNRLWRHDVLHDTNFLERKVVNCILKLTFIDLNFIQRNTNVNLISRKALNWVASKTQFFFK